MITINSAFKEHKRKSKVYLEMIPNFRKELLIDKVNAKITIQIYFSTIQLADYIKLFLEVRREFLSLYTFKDIFEDERILRPANTLRLFVESVNEEKDKFSYLIDGDLLNNYENHLNEMVVLLEDINNKWFNYYKHLELNNDTKGDKIFLDKDNMEIYKLVEIPGEDSNLFKLKRVKFVAIPGEDSNLFKLKRVKFYTGYYTQITEVLLDPDYIRGNLEYETFLEVELSKYFPEYFL